jgi:hypothetical protein
LVSPGCEGDEFKQTFSAKFDDMPTSWKLTPAFVSTAKAAFANQQKQKWKTITSCVVEKKTPTCEITIDTEIDKAYLIIAEYIVRLQITCICHNKAIKYGNAPVKNKNTLYMLAFESI